MGKLPVPPFWILLSDLAVCCFVNKAQLSSSSSTSCSRSCVPSRSPSLALALKHARSLPPSHSFAPSLSLICPRPRALVTAWRHPGGLLPRSLSQATIVEAASHVHQAHPYTPNAPGTEGASHPKTKIMIVACSIDVWRLLEPDCAMCTHCATLTLHTLV